GIMIHPHVVLMTLIFVDYLESGRLFLPVVHRIAALFRGGVRVALLRFLLDLVAGIAATGRTGDRGERLAAAAADLMTQEATHHGAYSGTEQAVFILDRLGPRDGLVVAFLPGDLDRASQCLGAEDFRRMRHRVHVIAGHRTTRDDDRGSRQRTSHKGNFHRSLLSPLSIRNYARPRRKKSTHPPRGGVGIASQIRTRVRGSSTRNVSCASSSGCRRSATGSGAFRHDSAAGTITPSAPFKRSRRTTYIPAQNSRPAPACQRDNPAFHRSPAIAAGAVAAPSRHPPPLY